MPKFYVMSGDLKHVMACGTPQQAVMRALTHVKVKDLAILVKVSEIGFDSVNDNDVLFLTELMLAEAGIRSSFCHVSDEPPGDEPNLAEG